MQENVRAEQANYLNFEKIFFSELEQFVIKKKMTSSFKNVNRQWLMFLYLTFKSSFISAW